MSIASLATHLAAGAVTFDLLIFDAHEQTLASALGALARANKAIIIGDSENQTENSLLHHARHHYPRITLDWHHHNQHLALSTLINHHYYHDRLQLCPSARTGDIQQHTITDGYYQNGNNPREIAALIADLVTDLRSNRQSSIGIIAMTATQAAAITTELNQTFLTDARLETAFDTRQGIILTPDETNTLQRDTIYFSLTYHDLTAVDTINPPIRERHLYQALNCANWHLHLYTSLANPTEPPSQYRHG